MREGLTTSVIFSAEHDKSPRYVRPKLLQYPGCGFCAEPAENAREKGKEVFMGGMPQLMLLFGLLSLGGMLANLGRSDVKEISFQHFKTHLLAQGLVEKVEVANKTSAKVYVRAGSAR